MPIVTKQIVKNTEKASSDVILNEINNYIKNGSYEYGFNGNLGTVENILQSGIINPSLVAIKAIEIATSIAIKFVNIGSVIYEENQEIDKKPMNDMMY